APNRLHRRPHVPVLWQQIPSRWIERVATNPASHIQRLRIATIAVVEDRRPDQVTVAGNDAMGGTVVAHLVGEQRGVNAAEYDKRAARSGGASDLILA